MNYKILKAKSKDYSSAAFETCAVENFNEIWEWIRSNELGLLRSRFFSDNRKALRKLFGKPSFCWRGSEFYYHCWVVDLGEAQVLVLTAKGKGTCHEIIVKRDGKEIPSHKQTVIDFLKWLTETLEQEDD